MGKKSVKSSGIAISYEDSDKRETRYAMSTNDGTENRAMSRQGLGPDASASYSTTLQDLASSGYAAGKISIVSLFVAAL